MKQILKALSLLITVCLLLTGCGTQEEAPLTTTLPELTVSVLNVGKADATLIRTEKGAVLIDTGDADTAETVCRNLTDLGVTKLDKLILTHLDKDHIGGAAAIIKAFSVETLIQSPDDSDSEEFQAYQAACKAAGLKEQKLTYDLTFSLGEADFKILPPQEKTYKNENNFSLITEMVYGNHRFLFAGDALEKRLNEYLESKPQPFDFVKMPHHGRREDNSDAFIEAVQPKWAVVTCTALTLPDAAVMDMLMKYGSNLMITCDGTVTAISDGVSLKVTQ